MLTLCQELCGKSYIIYPTWLLNSYYVARTSPGTADRPRSKFEQRGQEAGKCRTWQVEGKARKQHEEVRLRAGRGGVLGYTR